MKGTKKLKLIFMILICILIILIGFLGIYIKEGNKYKNWFENYSFDSDLTGATILELEVDNTSDKVYYDEAGNKVDSDEVTDESNYKAEEVKVNPEENLTKDNYEKTVKIIKERLKFLNADQYQVDYDKNTGKITITVVDDYIEDIESIIPMEGKLQLVDSNTQDVILDYANIISSEASYASLDEGYTTYISLKLNKSGIEKVNNFEKYSVIEETDEVNENEEEQVETESTEAIEINKFKLMFDDDEIAEISYDDVVLINKTLRITTNSDINSNSTIQSEMNTNTVISKLVTFGKLPVIYNLEAEEYVNNTKCNYINITVIIAATIAILSSIYFVIKYKTKGLIAILTIFTTISLFLIMIRLVNNAISLNGLAAIIVLSIFNAIITKNILDNSDFNYKQIIKNSYLNSLDIIIVLLIVFVVLSFANMSVINTMGQLMFWGWICVILGNILYTVPIFSLLNNKE